MVLQVIVLVAEIGKNIGYYEYLWLLLCIQKTMFKINEELLKKNRNSVSDFGKLYTNILECIRDLNNSIYGIPVLISFIGGYIADAVIVTYYHILFNGLFMKYKKSPTIAILNVSLKLINICLLFGVCSCTTKQVIILYFYFIKPKINNLIVCVLQINRISLVLQERSLIETDPKVHRQVNT